MKFSEAVTYTIAWLQREGRVSYRALKRELEIDDDFLEDLKADLIEVKELAVDKDGKMLVWREAKEDIDSLRVIGAGPDSEAAGAGPTSGERRQLTVMFCDIVGSTALAEQLDPEDLREVIQSYQHACVDGITRFEGHVAKYLGDGLLAYFGHPVAHEDDAARAVRAGLRIVASLQALTLPSIEATAGLQARVGIHTGLVVMGEMGSGQYRESLAIVGDTPNIAARLQEKAPPNGVVISPTTARLVAGLFELQDLGPQTLKGLSAPLPVYRVVAESGVQSRFEVAIRTGLTPIVGREPELGLLRDRWEHAKQGAGQVVALAGEAGIGKSRLMQALKAQVIDEGATRMAFRCSAYHSNSAFFPIIEHLQQVLQFQRDDRPATKLDKLQQGLARRRLDQDETLPLVAALLSLPHPDGYPPLALTPQRQRQKTQDALIRWLFEEAEHAPVYCVWEDIHWSDPSTLEFLRSLVSRVPTTRLLLLLTLRPDFPLPFGAPSYLSCITLGRLRPQQIKDMVAAVTGGKTLPESVLQQIVVKTDGVPLFVEELTKMVLDSGLLTAIDDHYELTGPLPDVALPSTLQGSLMARLDRLGTGKRVAQLGAAIGRQFSHALLQAVAALDEPTLRRELQALVQADLLYQRGGVTEATYSFKHALVRDAAYQSLLRSTRQQYHRQIAGALAAQFPETAESQPELLAHHYTEGRLAEQAVPQWLRAGQRAINRAAFTEAINHLTSGLELLQALPADPQRDRLELRLQSTIGIALQTVKGYAAPEVDSAYTRARALCQQVGDTAQLISVLRGQSLFYGVRADYTTALRLGQQMLAMAEDTSKPEYLVEAHLTMGLYSLYLGEFLSSRMHLERGSTLETPHERPLQAFQHVGHSRAMCLSYLARTLWILGYPDLALQRSREGLALAQTLSMPMTLAQAQGMHALIHQARREIELAHEWSDRTIAYATEHGFPYWFTLCSIVKGWLLDQQGQSAVGVAQFRRGLDGYRAIGAKLGLSWFLALMAELLAKNGGIEEGLGAMVEALAHIDDSGERYYEAEVHRVKGELLLTRGGPDAAATAEACFLRAIEVARRQSAKAWELRAATSLARLWRAQDRRREATELLTSVYGWFTEGFETPDLRDARCVLEGLGAG